MQKKFYYKLRNCEETFEEKVIGFCIIKFLYSSLLARPILKIITGNQFISYLYGKLMNTKYSKRFIYRFIKKHDINITESKKDISEFIHFNDFFYRELKPFSRPIDHTMEALLSPADGKILISVGTHLCCPPYETIKKISIKNNDYDICSLLQNKELSNKYENCSIVIIRLAPTDYHRFHFPCDGYAGETRVINGRYYSVSPIALSLYPKVFIENKRTLCEITNEYIGSFIYMEVGATMVGSIKQTYTPNSFIKKGDEKGYFEFGGSTVVLLFPTDKIIFDSEILRNSENGNETKIAMGERIGTITRVDNV